MAIIAEFSHDWRVAIFMQITKFNTAVSQLSNSWLVGIELHLKQWPFTNEGWILLKKWTELESSKKLLESEQWVFPEEIYRLECSVYTTDSQENI